MNCKKCGNGMSIEEKTAFCNKRKEISDQCKKCDCQLDIFEFCRKFDIPFIFKEYKSIFEKFNGNDQLSKTRYLSLMKLPAYRVFSFKDSYLFKE